MFTPGTRAAVTAVPMPNVLRRSVAPLLLLALSSRARAQELSVAAAPANAPPAPDNGLLANGGGGAVNGLYPLWEQTGVLQPAGTATLGYQHAQVGLGRVQIGTEPILDAHGAFNLNAKVALWRGPRLSLALLVGGYRFPSDAETITVGNLNPTGFTNYTPVWLVPITLAKTLRIGDRMALHWASTLLLSESSASEHRYVAGGQSLMFEVAASPEWTARLHLGAEGWPVQTMAHAGVSVAYTGKYTYASAGVGRRFTLDGEGSNLVMVDAGLRFQ
jgi:hypothetical protein